jgi:integrase
MPKKTGRKQKHYVSSTGETIVGLSRMTDGRWRIIGTETRWSEPDEKKAIAQYRRKTDSRQQMIDRIAKTDPEFAERLAEPIQYEGSVMWQISNGIYPWDEKKLLGWFATQLRQRPKQLAEITGIEELGYLTNLKPTGPLPSLETIVKVYKDYCQASTETKSKVIRAWNHFVKTTGIARLEDITDDVATAYQDAVHKQYPNPKTQKHLFSSVRNIFSFAKSRKLAKEAMVKILRSMEDMKPSGTIVAADPKPISVEDFQKLLAKATGDDKAMILLMLNCAMYLKETINLQWSDIKDGCVVTRREKTGKHIRTAVLWTETVEALKQVKRQKGEAIFYSSEGQPISISAGQAHFNRLADAAGIPDVTASHLRDGAHTAAVAGNVSTQLCNLLVGHSCGMADPYVLRNPAIVKPATDKVYEHYFKQTA